MAFNNQIRNRIGRTVTISYCIGYNVIEGQREEYYTLLIGDYTPERATRKLRKSEKDETITICEVNKDTDYYSMSIEQFLKLAEPTGRKDNGN